MTAQTQERYHLLCIGLCVLQPACRKRRKINIFVIENGVRAFIFINLYKETSMTGIHFQRKEGLWFIQLLFGEEGIGGRRIHKVNKDM
jgi:hypothetical protein